ncbi:uncharacterized protein LOC141876503 [Acropora palmata]|uniref:uncharacterized protein LOC141876503 n=1 Tax=Acropora palmata TaxID=6131 RepID=UPI003DA16E13
MENPRPTGQGGTLNMEYIKSLEGLLKLAEIFCLMIAFASLSGFTLHYSSTHYGGRFDFFYFATVVSWLLVIALFLIFALRLTDRLYEKCGNINWNLLLAIYSPVTAFLLLISSALVLDVAVRLRRSEEITDNQIHQDCDLVPCGNIEAAGAFGVFSMVLFSVDAIYYCMMNRRASSAPPLTFEGEPTDDVPQTEPLPY